MMTSKMAKKIKLTCMIVEVSVERASLDKHFVALRTGRGREGALLLVTAVGGQEPDGREANLGLTESPSRIAEEPTSYSDPGTRHAFFQQFEQRLALTLDILIRDFPPFS